MLDCDRRTAASVPMLLVLSTLTLLSTACAGPTEDPAALLGPTPGGSSAPSTSPADSTPPAGSGTDSTGTTPPGPTDTTQPSSTTPSGSTGSTQPAGGASFTRPAASNIYATKSGGRAWALADGLTGSQVNNDSVFVPETPNVTVVANACANCTVYRTVGDQSAENMVRLNVHSPALAAWWRDVEITGYFRFESVLSGGSQWPHIELEARGERHSESNPTKAKVNDGNAPPAGTVTWPWWDAFTSGQTINVAALGTTYHGNIYQQHGGDAVVLVEKELAHSDGYGAQRGQASPARPAVGKWFGWKVVVRNNAAGTAAKIECWYDAEANGNWVKATEVVDQGDWTVSDLMGTGAAPYGIATTQVIAWAGPWIGFRSDAGVLDFTGLEVREVDPY